MIISIIPEALTASWRYAVTHSHTLSLYPVSRISSDSSYWEQIFSRSRDSGTVCEGRNRNGKESRRLVRVFSKSTSTSIQISVTSTAPRQNREWGKKEEQRTRRKGWSHINQCHLFIKHLSIIYNPTRGWGQGLTLSVCECVWFMLDFPLVPLCCCFRSRKMARWKWPGTGAKSVSWENALCAVQKSWNRYAQNSDDDLIVIRWSLF